VSSLIRFQQINCFKLMLSVWHAGVVVMDLYYQNFCNWEHKRLRLLSHNDVNELENNIKWFFNK